MEDFFADDMGQFLKPQGSCVKKRTRQGMLVEMRLDVPAILDMVGESITKYVNSTATDKNAKVVLDDIAPGDITSIALSKWVSRLSQLKSMTLWDGSILNQEVADSLSRNCPNFNDLSFFRCSRENADPDIAAFFGALRPNSLESLEALSAQGIGPETLLELNNHSMSLTTLKIDGLRYVVSHTVNFTNII